MRRVSFIGKGGIAKSYLSFVLSVLLCGVAQAQLPLRPDAFPAIDETPSDPKSLLMADDPSAMSDWCHYPTYGCYVAMMQRYAESYPALCRLDTIGWSVNGRLILSLHITADVQTPSDKPQFFYSATMHGDELVGFHFMLHLIDTLLTAYGSVPRITELLNTTDIYINPLSNPDGTYYGGDNTVVGSRRDNAHDVDLNRNYPDPFAHSVKSLNVEPENEAMIDYVSVHRFALSANLHSGAEVMNYPWDSFVSARHPHPYAAWWQVVCRRFVDSCRAVAPGMFTSVCPDGYIAGGDWYVISNGRQDYMNYVHHIRELTMELSDSKRLSSEELGYYWKAQCVSLINYIGEVHTITGGYSAVAEAADRSSYRVYPNPACDMLTVETPEGSRRIDVSRLPAGVHVMRLEDRIIRFIKL